MNDDPLNGNLDQRLALNTQRMDWVPSPGGHVLRKRLHRVGPAEAGQVTSLVYYPPGARFPRHDHPEGEEILVLEGTFSDDQGDWPAGSYLLNPEGYSHAPYSEGGCTLFVKLRQYPGEDRHQVATNTAATPWQADSRTPVEQKVLYKQAPYTDVVRLEHWPQPAQRGALKFPQGAELFVITGHFVDEAGDHPRWSWLRIPAGQSVTPTGGEACEVYIKEGGFTYLY